MSGKIQAFFLKAQRGQFSSIYWSQSEFQPHVHIIEFNHKLFADPKVYIAALNAHMNDEL